MSDSEERGQGRGEPVSEASTGPRIQLRDASVLVPDHTATTANATKRLLEPLTLDLTERRIGVIGANGSGKSTFLRLLNGLLEPSTGRVTVNDLDTTRQGRKVRQLVGFIFTDPLAQLVMSTPIEDVALSLRRNLRGSAARTHRARELLAARNLEHLADQSIYDLSGGERQLVALTSVLAVDPAVLVADEPTTLLDLRNRNRLLGTFDELDQQLVFSSHDLDFAATADRVLVFDGGRLVADGAPAAAIEHYRELMRRG